MALPLKLNAQLLCYSFVWLTAHGTFEGMLKANEDEILGQHALSQWLFSSRVLLEENTEEPFSATNKTLHFFKKNLPQTIKSKNNFLLIKKAILCQFYKRIVPGHLC